MTYKELCQALLDAGASVHPFSDFTYSATRDFPFSISHDQKEGKKIVLMRHDVDHNPAWARDLAKVENELGIRSTFFALTNDNSRGWWVNKDRRQQMYDLYLEIQDMGHEVGLHYDFLGQKFLHNQEPLDSATEILEGFRSAGLNIRGCASHGSAQLRKALGAEQKIKGTPYPLDYVNYVVWEEIRGPQKTLDLKGKTQNIPCMKLSDLDLAYEAYWVSMDWYTSDSSGLGARGQWNVGQIVDEDRSKRGLSFVDWDEAAKQRRSDDPEGAARSPMLLNWGKQNRTPVDVLKEDIAEGEVLQILVHPIWWKDKLR